MFHAAQGGVRDPEACAEICRRDMLRDALRTYASAPNLESLCNQRRYGAYCPKFFRHADDFIEVVLNPLNRHLYKHLIVLSVVKAIIDIDLIALIGYL